MDEIRVETLHAPGGTTRIPECSRLRVVVRGDTTRRCLYGLLGDNQCKSSAEIGLLFCTDHRLKTS
jgi:hypothetical protein